MPRLDHERSQCAEAYGLVVLHAAVAALVGLLFVWSFAPTPTVDNGGPPSEPFVAAGALLYLAVAIEN